MNKCQLIGNLTTDPEAKQFPNGTAICNFTVATNRRYKDKEGEQHDEVEYTKCCSFAKLAEIMNQYLCKGKKVYVEGRLKTRTWDDDSGKKHYMTEMIVEQFEFLDARKGGDPTPSPQNQGNAGGTPGGSGPAAPAAEAPQESGERQDIDPDVKVDDLPF